MEPTKIPPVRRPVPSVRRPVSDRPRDARRHRRLPRTIQAGRRVNPSRRGGRAWINGREVGGPDPRYAHLAGTYD